MIIIWSGAIPNYLTVLLEDLLNVGLLYHDSIRVDKSYLCVPIIDRILVTLKLYADDAVILSDRADNFGSLQVVVTGVFYTIFIIWIR